MTWNSWPYNREFVLKGLALIEPYRLITVKRIVFIQNEQELDALACKSQYSNDERMYIASHRGTWLNEHQDIVVNTSAMWECIKEIEPDESLQLLPLGILLFDVLLHEIYHAFQFNPLLSMRIEGKSMNVLEAEANSYVEKHLRSTLNK